jgi:type IV pilus assembly protein PilY1
VCVSSGVGNYQGGLVQALNDIPANAWTPFAEAYYNAIGYFARTDSGASRTALRLNGADFIEALNPSQYRCQQNFVLLVTDGSSTADRNSSVNDLAGLYAQLAGKPSGWASTCANYAGSKNLPVLAWIAKNENISEFSLASATNPPLPQELESRDVITTFVVSTGGSNGETGECNSINLLSETAANGGTTLRQATNNDLGDKIREIFNEIERQSASGTAASILSNSQGSGANILQAVFHPRKKFVDGATSTEATWVGEIHNLWYYIDPQLGNSTIREDTDFSTTSPHHVLDLRNDYIVSFFFDYITNQTMVRRHQDTDGDGDVDVAISGVMAPDQLSAIWRAGEKLWQRNISVSGQERTIKTSIGAGLINFATGNAAALAPYLQASDSTEAEKIINYVSGIDYLADATFRPRTVTIGGSTGVWKLGDIVSSTPRLLSSGQLNLFDSVYGDTSYKSYVNSSNYRSRGTVFAGANDGMLHAFNLGSLSTTPSAALSNLGINIGGTTKAALTGDDLGHEEWAFIPKQALPYLTYLKDKTYEEKHIYFIDGPTVLFDASIGTPALCEGDYWTCEKDPQIVTGANALDSTRNPWRTILIGSMGIGGATRKSCEGVNSCVETPRADPGNASKGLGYSSYFALDITDPTNPTLMWEFSDEALGYSTTGPAIIRIGPKNKNGKWFVVFGSGPTGPIDKENKQFLARSNQSLKLFVLDLKTGDPIRTIDTSETYADLATAFSGPLVGSQIDTDRWDPTSNGSYKDDALHFGYVKNNDSDPPAWTQGGVMRLLTKESENPADWVVSKVVEDVGPVTTSVARLVDRKKKHLWLYFGTGRYYHKQDDQGSRRAIFGIKEPCYYTTSNDLNPLCAENALTKGDLTNKSADDAADTEVSKGWFIDLDQSEASFAAERVITDPVALTNGTVFFTTFKPTPDVCGYGGDSLVWVTKFDTGVAPPSRVMKGKILLQLSTGTFKEITIQDAFPAKGGRRTTDSLMTGKPPSDPPPIITNAGNKPVKKILHIQEK